MATAQQRILVVDDDRQMREAITSLLRVRDFLVLACTQPREALEAMAMWRPDALVLDVDLPTMSGFEMYRELLARGHAVPVVFISGDSTEVKEEQAIELGAALLQKPFGSAALFRALGEALSD